MTETEDFLNELNALNESGLLTKNKITEKYKEHIVQREFKRFYTQVVESTRQLIHRKLAKFCVEEKGNDIFFMYEAVNLLIAVVGEDYLKYKYKDYEGFHKSSKNWGSLSQGLRDTMTRWKTRKKKTR